jgi:hypothetical protein
MFVVSSVAGAAYTATWVVYVFFVRIRTEALPGPNGLKTVRSSVRKTNELPEA